MLRHWSQTSAGVELGEIGFRNFLVGKVLVETLVADQRQRWVLDQKMISIIFFCNRRDVMRCIIRRYWE